MPLVGGVGVLVGVVPIAVDVLVIVSDLEMLMRVFVLAAQDEGDTGERNGERDYLASGDGIIEHCPCQHCTNERRGSEYKLPASRAKVPRTSDPQSDRKPVPDRADE